MIRLILILVFCASLYGAKHDIHKEIENIKLELQEIELIGDVKLRKNKLREIEKKLSALEVEFKVNKKLIDKTFEH